MHSPTVINGIAFVPASESDGPYAVLGNDGTLQAFYSGRAGDCWLKGAPFSYVSFAEAQRKARLFNRNTELHGYHFMVVGLVTY